MNARLAALTLCTLAPLVATSCGEADVPVSVTVWNGYHHTVGDGGLGQPDHNVMGIATGNELSYSLDWGEEVPLVTGEGTWGFRRLGGPGHFNIEVPIDSLEVGQHQLRIHARGRYEEVFQGLTIVRVAERSPQLPKRIEWSEVDSLYHEGQIVDGEWRIDDGGLRSAEPLYDRLFLIGDRSWRDYEIATTVTVHRVPAKNAPMSGGSGVGVIARFQGHTVSPPRFPEATPKWGYQPFGAILWLRWNKTAPTDPPVRQFYRGDRDESQDFAALTEFTEGKTFRFRASCTTDPEDAKTTTYRLRVWPDGAPEPSTWDYEVRQTSDEAHQEGGVALVAHHVDVTFGDVEIR